MEGPTARGIGERVLQLFQRQGLSDDDAARLLVSLAGFTLGSALYRSSRVARTRFANVNPTTPLVSKLSKQLARVTDDSRQFDDGIEALLLGYRANPARVDVLPR